MKRLVFTLAFSALAASVVININGCGPGDEGNGQERKANGPVVHYGGVFRMNETEDFRTLYPLNIVEVVGDHIGSQVYEGLVKFNQKDLSIMPGLATRWDIKDSSTHFIFHMRKGVFFHDDPCFPGGKGREVKASDIKYCFDMLCTASPNNQQYSNTFKDRVAGANEYFASTDSKKPLAGGVSGVTVPDDSTVDIRLVRPMPGFLNILATQGCWIYPQEALAKYGDEMRVHCVGTGPFRVKSIKEGDAVILEYNPKYWMFDEWNNRLPYLDIVEFRFIKDKRSEIIAFKNKELDMVFRLPVEMANDIMGELSQAKEHGADFVFQSNPAMSLTYYGFQNKLSPFDNVKVRQAFNYAINREYICEKVLMGDAVPAVYGIVPPSLPGYDAKTINGYNYDPDKAKQLLAEAGYPGGKNFPATTLYINNGGGDRNTMTADYVRKQLNDVLGINVTVELVPFAQHLENIETGKALFWRTGWIADYPDPETFLTTLYGKHIPATMNERSSLNSVRYSSPLFDSLFEAAANEPDAVKRTDLYHRADQVAMSDAAIMPIYYETNDRLVQKNVRGFDINPMEYRDMTRVYFAPDENATGAKKDTAQK
ncbi:MAG TPA: ABC transporter substrate-binding protein [Bacteroidia bacterium]|nr:ABC transporter substrate-binding protein [Bacteroidia bacterium]